MAGAPEELTSDEVSELTLKFEEAALSIVATPTLCNRFYLLSLGDLTSLVFGSGFYVTRSNNEKKCVAQATGAVAFSKPLAVELVLFLEKHLHITEEDRAEAMKQNSHLLSE